MEYEITIDGRSAKVALARSAGEFEQYEFTDAASGRSGRILVVERSPSRLILSIANRLYAVSPRARSAGHVEFLLNGESVAADIAAARASPSAGTDAPSAPELVVSSFPAKVVRVPVARGEQLSHGATVIVLEAMKMESYVAAPKDCTVVDLFVKEGEMVARGAKLVRLRFS
jgi:biotin carboxyl carrier protein